MIKFLWACPYLERVFVANHAFEGEPVRNQVSERDQRQGAKTLKYDYIRIMNPCLWPFGNFSSVN